MPSLSPGTPGAKEVYGISVLKRGYVITIPPAALKRYGIGSRESVLLVAGRIDEPGFGLIKKETAEKSVFSKFILRSEKNNVVYAEKGKSWTVVEVANGKLKLSRKMADAFHLEIGDKLMTIKSTTTTLSFSHVEVWKKKFKKHGLDEAIENISKLEIF